MENPGERARDIGARQMGVQNIRPLCAQESRDPTEEERIVSAIGSQVNDSDIFPLKITAKRTAVFHMLPQTGHDNFNILSLQVPTERQKMHFGPTSRKRVDQMKNFHQQKLVNEYS
jgi:hypothetical protein